MSNRERQLLKEGTNKLLGDLVCYSCQEHNRCSFEDKYLSLEDSYHVSIFADGNFKLFSYGSRDSIKEEAILVGLNTLTSKLLEKFGDGVCLTFLGAKLECASCGSQEFITPSN